MTHQCSANPTPPYLNTMEKTPERACKPDSVTPREGPVIISLDPALLPDSSGQPGSLGRAILPPRRWRRGRSPIWPCSRWGLPCRPRHRGRGALLPHLFTLTPPRGPFGPLRGAVCFLWHFPWGHPRSALPTTLPCGVRTFLCPRLAAEAATTRPSPARSILPHSLPPLQYICILTDYP